MTVDERLPKRCPRCRQVCTYDGWDHVHVGGLGIGSCRPALVTAEGTEESVDLTPGVVWTDSQLSVVRSLTAELAKAQAKVQAVEALAAEFNTPVPNGSFPGQTALYGGGDVAFRILRALDGPR